MSHHISLNQTLSTDPGKCISRIYDSPQKHVTRPGRGNQGHSVILTLFAKSTCQFTTKEAPTNNRNGLDFPGNLLQGSKVSNLQEPTSLAHWFPKGAQNDNTKKYFLLSFDNTNLHTEPSHHIKWLNNCLSAIDVDFFLHCNIPSSNRGSRLGAVLHPLHQRTFGNVWRHFWLLQLGLGRCYLVDS